jgi:hypothetical protein
VGQPLDCEEYRERDQESNTHMNTDQVIGQVEEHRDLMANARKFGDGVDNTIFGMEEGAELYDGWMRQDTTYQRNNDKQIDPSKEAADLGYMIASAIIAIRRGNMGEVDRREAMLAAIMERLAYTMIALDRHHENAALNNLETALNEWIALCALCGWNPAEILQAKIEKDNARYLAKTGA